MNGRNIADWTLDDWLGVSVASDREKSDLLAFTPIPPMKHSAYWCSVVLSAVAVSNVLLGETINLTASRSDAEVNAVPAVESATSSSARVGLSTINNYGRAAVFVFEFPKLAFGEEITSASFATTLKSFSGTGISFSGDLYALGTSWSPTVLGTDYAHGSFATTPGAKGLQDDFLTPSSVVGTVATQPGASAALKTELSTERAAGAGPGMYYFLRVNPDFATPTNAIKGYNLGTADDSTVANRPSLTVTTDQAPQKGRVLLEYWNDLAGSSIANLTGYADYPTKPSHRELAISTEVPSGVDSDLGSRLRAYFYPAETGSYQFYIAGGDAVELLLSTDDQPVNATTIASASAATGFRTWTTFPQQASGSITLTAGQRYYLEARQKQSTTTGSLSIGFIPPGTSTIALLPAALCEPVDAQAEFSGHAAVSALISQARPRLMVSPAAIVRLKADIIVPGSKSAQWYASLVSQGETMLSASLTSATDPRPIQHRVFTLGLLHLLSDDAIKKTAYKNKIYAELSNAISWGNWAATSFLELGEMAGTFGVAYDWLYNDWTSTEKSVILNAIRDQALDPALTQYAANAWWVNDKYNWAIVVNSGIAISALSVLGDETTKAPSALDASMAALRDGPAIPNLGPDGAAAEAPVYWDFPVRYLAYLFASMETATGTCFNLDHRSGASSLGSFPVYNVGPINRVFNFADNDGDNRTTNWSMQFLARKYNQPIYAWRQKLDASPYPFDLLWHDPRIVTPTGLDLPPSTYFRNAGIVILRSEWENANALFAGLKSGLNGFGHSELEQGSFVLDALGVRWAVDLGRDNYSLPNYWTTNTAVTPNRWMYYRCRAEGNNTIVINPSTGPDQRLAANVPVIKFSGRETNPLAVLDLTSAYSDKVSGLKRGMRFLNGVVQLQDELTSSTAVDFNWFMHTATTITLSGDAKSATLASGTKRLQVRIQAPSTATLSVTAASPLPTSPNPSGMASNTAYQKLRLQLASTTSTTVTIAFLPYEDGDPVPALPATDTLANWNTY